MRTDYVTVTADQLDAFASLMENEAARMRLVTAGMREKSFSEMDLLRYKSLVDALEEIPKSVNAAFEALTLKTAGIVPGNKKPATKTDDDAEKVVGNVVASRKKRRKKP